MPGTLLQRMILGQLLRVFLLALTGLTGLFVLAGLVAEATQRGLAPSQVLAVLPLLVPNTLPYTLPATTLFATCVVYGRLAADNELLAVKSAGARVGPLLLPSIVLGLMAATITTTLYYKYIPLTHRVLRNTVVGDVEDLLYTLLKRNGCLRHPKMPYSMWVREVQGRHLIDAVFKQRNEQGNYTIVARAREAEIQYDATTRTIKVIMPNCVVIGDSNHGGAGVIGYQTYDVPLRDELLTAEYPNRASDMSWPELRTRRDQIEVEIAQLQAEVVSPPTNEDILPDDHKQDLKRFRENSIKSRQRDIRGIDAEWHQRPAIGFGCLCFVLIGAPVGLWFGKADYLSAFVSCFLPTLFLYYPLLLCGTNLAKDGAVPAVVGIWGANLITVSVALVIRVLLLRR